MSDDEARAVRAWLDAKGMRFETGSNEESELTDAQIHQQCKMYVAALRIADEVRVRDDRHPVSAGFEGPCPGV
ncbi:MAG: hypothetical protein R2762_24385 [Bryobacteraceae bacterium]